MRRNGPLQHHEDSAGGLYDLAGTGQPSLRRMMGDRDHVLRDILAPGLDAVIVGTAAGDISAARGHYYSFAGNRFWELLHRAGLTPRRLRPAEDHTLPEYGLGLTDLNKRMHQGHDRGLTYDVPGFIQRLNVADPVWVVFNGREAARAYARDEGIAPVGWGQQPWGIGASSVFVIPSSSGSANGAKNRLELWQAAGRRIAETRT